MLEEAKNKIIGGVVVLVIGGTAFTVSQTDIVNNFAQETGMTQQEAQEYVDKSQGELESFTKVGEDLVASGNDAVKAASEIDCANYTYEWVSSKLSCSAGKKQFQKLGESEIALGDCYKALDANPESSAQSKIKECIEDIDTVNKSYDAPITKKLMDKSDLKEAKDSNLYNKSVLRAALESE